MAVGSWQSTAKDKTRVICKGEGFEVARKKLNKGYQVRGIRYKDNQNQAPQITDKKILV